MVHVHLVGQELVSTVQFYASHVLTIRVMRTYNVKTLSQAFSAVAVQLACPAMGSPVKASHSVTTLFARRILSVEKRRTKLFAYPARLVTNPLTEDVTSEGSSVRTGRVTQESDARIRRLASFVEIAPLAILEMESTAWTRV